MKKFTLLLVALLLLSTGVFAQTEVAISASISGSATLTWGIDLDDNATGFANATSSELKVTIVPKASQETSSDAEVYGWIKLKDYEWIATGSPTGPKAPAVEARLILGPAYINILGVSDEINMATLGKGLATVGLATNGKFGQTINPYQEYAGLAVGANFDALSFVVGVSSRYDWRQQADVTDHPANKNVDNDYNFYGKVNLLAVEGLTLGVAANYEMFTENLGLGAEAGYKLPLGDFALELLVGFDFLATDPSVWELGAGVRFALPGSTLVDTEYFGLGKRDIKPGLGVGFALNSAEEMGITVSLFDGDLIPVLNLVALADFFIANSTTTIGLGVRASADLGVVVPYAEFATKLEGADPLFLKAGVDIKVIENTVFTLAYQSADLNTLNGVITFATKITF